MTRRAKLIVLTTAVIAPVVVASTVTTVGSWVLALLREHAPQMEQSLPGLSRWAFEHAEGIRLAMLFQALFVLLAALVILRRARDDEARLASLMFLTVGSLSLVIMSLVLCALAWMLPFAGAVGQLR